MRYSAKAFLKPLLAPRNVLGVCNSGETFHQYYSPGDYHCKSLRLRKSLSEAPCNWQMQSSWGHLFNSLLTKSSGLGMEGGSCHVSTCRQGGHHTSCIEITQGVLEPITVVSSSLFLLIHVIPSPKPQPSFHTHVKNVLIYYNLESQK